jgi:hypothetical protein
MAGSGHIAKKEMIGAGIVAREHRQFVADIIIKPEAHSVDNPQTQFQTCNGQPERGEDSQEICQPVLQNC